jgi:hypothetical protein
MAGPCEAQMAAGDITGGEGWLTYPVGERLAYSIGGLMPNSAG